MEADVTILSLTNKPECRSDPDPNQVIPLTQGDIRQLYLANHPRIAADAIARALYEMPGISQWHPASGEFLLASPWRHRADIPMIRDLTAFVHEDELVQAMVQAARARGMRGIIASESYEKRRPEFYLRNGMRRLETVIAFVHHRVQDYLDVNRESAQQFIQVTMDDLSLIEQIIALDHAAFGPIWGNSHAEFAWWMSIPSVEVWVGMIDDEVTSYYGTTYYQKFGHLDRIAVHPDYQGKGLGADTLMAAMQRMADLRRKNAALCTQADNVASQALYRRAGFERYPNDDYDMYGILFDEANNA